MNLIELEEALFPGGKPTEDLRKKVEELKAVNARQAHLDGAALFQHRPAVTLGLSVAGP